MSYAFTTVASPVSDLKIVASEKGLVAVPWPNDDPVRVRLLAITEDKKHPVLLDAERQLSAYLAGNRHAFTVPLDRQGTPFQKPVWEALLTIPTAKPALTRRSRSRSERQPRIALSARQTAETPFDHRTLPSGHRCDRRSNRIRRRPRHETEIARLGRQPRGGLTISGQSQKHQPGNGEYHET
jgi:hypothetical protein